MPTPNFELPTPGDTLLVADFPNELRESNEIVDAVLSTQHQEVETAKQAAEDARDAAIDAAGLVGAPAGEVVRSVLDAEISDPESNTNSGLSKRYAIARDTASLIRLATVGAADSNRAMSEADQIWQSTAGITENWNNLDGWTSARLQAVGNKLYSLPESTHAGAKRYYPGMSSPGRIVGEINVVAPGEGNGLTLIGINTSTNDADPNTIGSPYLFAIGIREDGIPVRFLATSTPLDTAPLPPGRYYVSVILTDVEVAMSLHNADSSIFYNYGSARASLDPVITHVAVWNSDSRATSGHSLGPLVARIGAITTGNPLGTADTRPRWARYAVPSRHSEFTMIATPANYDPRKPTPVVIYAHGLNDTELDSTYASRPDAIGKITKALVDAGFIMAAGRFGGSANWGNEASLTAMQELYNHLRDTYNVGPIVMIGHSMGGLVTLSSIAERTIPNIVGFVGIEPVVDLRAAYDGSFAASIRSAYGIAANGSDYNSKTAGHNPALRQGYEFRGLPMWLTASHSDGLVPQSQHTDILRDLVAGNAESIEFHQATGNHVDPSHFQPESVVAFCRSVTRGGLIS